jgi:hypothetical protein
LIEAVPIVDGVTSMGTDTCHFSGIALMMGAARYLRSKRYRVWYWGTCICQFHVSIWAIAQVTLYMHMGKTPPAKKIHIAVGECTGYRGSFILLIVI